MNTVTATSYRVIKTTTVGFGEDAVHTQQVVWQGTDTKALSKQYPPSEIFGADPLGHSEIEGGHIRFNYRFEKLVGDEWREIDDPRVRLSPMTALEREIDAENRRLFPGDFEQEDTYEDYDDYLDDAGYMCEHCHDAGCSHCEPEPEPCEECGMDPCMCDMIAKYETELDTCPHCGGTPEAHNERACKECGDCLCGGECGYDYEADACYFCNRVGCEGGCYEEKYTFRVEWTTSHLRHFWRAYYWLHSLVNRRAA